jgi:HAE1 family hydrophobic/amphiphilic exporter-1
VTSLIGRILSRPVGVLVVSFSAVVMGVLSFRNIPAQLLPDGFQGRNITIWVRMRQSAPPEAEKHVAIPIEEALGSVSGIKTIRTRCNANEVRVSIELKPDADPAAVERDVRDRIQRVEPDLPDDADRVRIRRFSPQDIPVIWFSCSGDMDRLDLSDFVEDVVVPRLESLPGVARANPRGLVKRSVRIWLDKEEILRRQLDLRQLLGRLRDDNLAIDLGEIEESGRKSYLRATMEFSSLDDIRAFPVASGATLGQIARVEVVPSLDQGWGRFNGNAVIASSVYKTSDANTVEVCARVREFFKDLEENHPQAKGLRIRAWFDQGEEIELALSTLYENALYGGALAMAVLLVFFRRMRMTLLVAAAIPLSLMMAVCVLYLSGDSLNMFSMMGLTLAVGMLIDNAIVVVEAILRRRETGDTPSEAATSGTSEVALAVLTGTLTTIVVFLPVIFLGDDANARLMMGALGGPIAYALLASLAVALVLVPLGSIYLRRRNDKPAPARAVGLGGMRGLYGRILARILHYRFVTVVLALVFVVSMGIPLGMIGQRESMGGGGSSVRIRTRWPRHYTMSDASKTTKIYEKYLTERFEDLELSGVYAHFEKMGGFIMTWKKPGSRKPLSEIRDAIREGWPQVPGVWTNLESMVMEGKTSITLEGEDPNVLDQAMDRIEKRLEGVESVAEVVRERDLAMQELRITIDSAVADRVDFNPEAIRGTIGWIVRGARLRDYYSKGRDLPLLIEMDPDTATEVRDLGDILIPTGRGALPLSALTRFGVHNAPVSIVRHDGRRVSELEALGRKDDTKSFHEDVSRALAGVKLPPGVRFKVGGSWERLQQNFAELAQAMILAIVLVFLLTGVLFESVLLPLAVLLAIPPAIAGSYWALYITGKPLDELAVLGLILLAGVVVNNGIVLVDRVQQRRRQGLPLKAAVAVAGRDRMRPVIMTALTTIAGLLPMALFGSPNENIHYDTLAVAVIGGLVASTLVTLFLVPVAFTILVDLTRILRGVFRSAVDFGGPSR